MSEIESPIIIEKEYTFSSDVVWKAITEHAQMTQWFFSEIPEFKAEAGFKTEFVIDTGERQFNHLWTIKEVVDGTRIVYDWRYEKYAGVGTVTFDLMEAGTGSLLRITNEGLESFPRDLPEFTEEACRSGWTWMLDSLNSYLNGELLPE